MSEINPQFTESKQNEYMCSRRPEWCWVYELDHIWGGRWENTVLHQKKMLETMKCVVIVGLDIIANK